MFGFDTIFLLQSLSYKFCLLTRKKLRNFRVWNGGGGVKNPEKMLMSFMNHKIHFSNFTFKINIVHTG